MYHHSPPLPLYILSSSSLHVARARPGSPRWPRHCRASTLYIFGQTLKDLTYQKLRCAFILIFETEGVQETYRTTDSGAGGHFEHHSCGVARSRSENSGCASVRPGWCQIERRRPKIFLPIICALCGIGPTSDHRRSLLPRPHASSPAHVPARALHA